VIGAGAKSSAVGAGGGVNINIEITLMNSDIAVLLMSVMIDLLSRVGK
jgi:hypothetical protein